jgi:hypothetical protein
LGIFEEAVKAGEISPGSHLLIFMLDRLTRQQPVTVAEPLIISILQAGTKIHIVSDYGLFFEAADIENEWKMNALRSKLFGGYQYTKDLSLKVSNGKAENRKDVLSGKRKVFTGQVPLWIIADVEKDEYRLSETTITKPFVPKRGPQAGREILRVEKVDYRIVQQIFALAIDGLGSLNILRKLNTQGLSESWIGQTLANPAVLGQLTMNWTENGKQMSETVNNYPRVIDNETWAAARAAVQRNFRSGKDGQNHSSKGRSTFREENLFSGLLRDVTDPLNPVGIWFQAANGRSARLTANRSKVSKGHSLRYDYFQSAFLKFLGFLNWRNITAQGTPAGLKEVAAKRTKIDNERGIKRGQIAKFQKWMLKPETTEAQADAYTGAIATLTAETSKLDDAISKLDTEIAAAQAQVATLESPEALMELRTKLLKAQADSDTLRKTKAEIAKRIQWIDLDWNDRHPLAANTVDFEITFVNGVVQQAQAAIDKKTGECVGVGWDLK